MVQIQNALHGKMMKIVIDDDASYYYIGRVTANELKRTEQLERLLLNVTVSLTI